MRHRIRLCLSLVVLCGFCLLSGCAGGGTALLRQPAPTAMFTLSQSNLADLARHTLRAFSDSLPPDSLEQEWVDEKQNYPSADNSGVRELAVLVELLKRRDYTVCELIPDSYESIRVLSALPVVMYVLVLRFPGTDVQPLDLQNHPNLGLVASHLSRTRIDMVTHLSAKETQCALITHLGDRISGSYADRITGQVYPSKVPEGKGGYSQVVRFVIVSPLPRFELQAHLDEWRERLPHSNFSPRVRELAVVQDGVMN